MASGVSPITNDVAIATLLIYYYHHDNNSPDGLQPVIFIACGALIQPAVGRCGGLLVVVSGASPITFVMSRLAGDPMTPPTNLPASTSDIWMMIMVL